MCIWLMHACICTCIHDRILNIAFLYGNCVCMVCMVCANQHDMKNSLIEYSFQCVAWMCSIWVKLSHPTVTHSHTYIHKHIHPCIALVGRYVRMLCMFIMNSVCFHDDVHLTHIHTHIYTHVCTSTHMQARGQPCCLWRTCMCTHTYTCVHMHLYTYLKDYVMAFNYVSLHVS